MVVAALVSIAVVALGVAFLVGYGKGYGAGVSDTKHGGQTCDGVQ